ncbi:MAG TPA: FAD-binding oxidoreductase [Candidatus Limnocylindrales bacterium]|nr:FAD-binding oxidoreductase [Candidatus Limnocylindrales bacterium]
MTAAGDETYDRLRPVFNTMFDSRPAVIVRPLDEDDIACAIAVAAEHEIPLAVRSGGHSLAGHGSGEGVVIDLHDLRRLTVDPIARRAVVEPGLSTGSYTRSTFQYRLGTSFGDSPSVGIGGITLSGGFGYLVRKHGLAVDELVSARVVTADGRRLTATADEHPDLFWALRGGGGNFGVATSFEFKLESVSDVYGGWLVLPASRDVLRDAVAIAAEAPDELTTVINVFRMPGLAIVPPSSHGKLVVAIAAVWAGGLANASRVLRPLRQLARPYLDAMSPMAYPEIYRYSRNAGLGPHGTCARTTFLEVLNDPVIDAILEFTARAPSPDAAGQIRVLGGAFARVAPDATAFALRDCRMMFTSLIEFDAGLDPAPYNAWTEKFWSAIRPHGHGAYVAFLQNEGDARVREAYPSSTFRRMAEIKRKYDPDNRFRVNQNIAPSAA